MRVSTGSQSCDRQVTDLSRFCEERGFEVAAIYREVESGAKDDRPERAKLIKQVHLRKFRFVICHELTRWGRNTVDLITTIEDLALYGCGFIAKNAGELDPRSAAGKMMLTAFAMIAEYERSCTIERIKSGQARARSKGKYIGGKRHPDQTRHQAIALREEGKSYSQIATLTGVSRPTVIKWLKGVASYENGDLPRENSP